MKTYNLTMSDVAMLVTLVSQVDPEKYDGPEAKSLIYRCQALVEKDKVYIKVIQ